MKGLYMVDADRGFVQYFENLLFTNSNEYKMLGHNFKANEFLLKIKERPDLLDKIDLLFINPKLNDLNGLELYKKVQSKRKDINVCILVNENIKTFYENDIAELGIENVILYPNSDEYYLKSVAEIFKKIENKNISNSLISGDNSVKKNTISDKELFSELNSDDFLSQFDFDSLASDMFAQKEKIEEPLVSKPIVEDTYNNSSQGFNINNQSGFNNFVSEPSPNNEFNKEVPSFVTPNFDFDDTKDNTDIFSFGEDLSKEPSFGEYSGYKEPVKSNQNPLVDYGSEGGANPLDLGAFGVSSNATEAKNGFNIFETPEFKKKESVDDIFGTQAPNNNMLDNSSIYETKDLFNNPYEDTGFSNNSDSLDLFGNASGFSVDGFEAPYDNKVSPKTTNLQNINRPNIDNMDEFPGYGVNNNVANDDYFNVNNNTNNPVANPVNNPMVSEPAFAPERHGGFKNNVSPEQNLGYKNQINQPFSETPNVNVPNSSPYDEYLNVSKNIENQRDTNLNGYPIPGDFSAPKEEPRPFGGFDFGKSQNNSAKPDAHRFDMNPITGTPVNNGYNALGNDNSPAMGLGMEDSFSGASNKSYIENMYNNVGVDDLSYVPSTQSTPMNSPVRHERMANSAYKEVPDFARQIVAFYSTKGGIGKTSLAVNATIQLAKYSKKKICLIDFDLTNANVHTHLGILDATYDLSVVSNFESEIDSFSLSRIVTPYRVKDKNGDTVEFDVIVGFKEMKMAQRFSEKEVYKILSILEEMYDIVVVDTHPVYTDLAVSTILKKATKIVFVTEQEMTALNGAKDFILASKKYSIPSEKLFMVLNRYKAQTSIFNKNRIEKGLNKTVLATIPFDMDSLRDAVNTNNPVTLSNPDSELARAYIDIAKIIDPKMVIPEESKGFFKLFKK